VFVLEIEAYDHDLCLALTLPRYLSLLARLLQNHLHTRYCTIEPSLSFYPFSLPAFSSLTQLQPLHRIILP
jgi:hypothetical protein